MRLATIGITLALAFGFATTAGQAQTWKPPTDSERCPSKWGAGDERGSANHMKPDSVLKAALLKRAVEDIQRIVQLRQAKPALQTLLQRGSVGDELWQRFQRAEQEMEIEVKDVVNEVGLAKDF